MLNPNKFENMEKDRVLQEIHDELEKLKWGGECSKMVVKLVFDGEFKLRPIRSFKSYKRDLKCFQ